MIADLQYDIVVDLIKQHKHKRYALRDLDDIDHIIIHHSLTEQGSAPAFARYHVDHHDWPGIGYHFVIDASGIHQTNYLDTMSYHCSGHNADSIGICHVGNFDRTAPDDHVYLAYIRCILAVDIVLGRQLPIRYHNEFSTKSCPGKLFDYDLFQRELAEMRKILDNYE